MIVMAVLLAIAVGFQAGARIHASDAAAKSNIDVAIPAFQAYALDNDGYTGMTLPDLQSSYSKGIQGIEVVSSGAVGYCAKSTIEGRTWFKKGPAGAITKTSCSWRDSAVSNSTPIHVLAIAVEHLLQASDSGKACSSRSTCISELDTPRSTIDTCLRRCRVSRPGGLVLMLWRTLGVMGCIALGIALPGCGGGSEGPSGLDLTAQPPMKIEVNATNGLIAFESGGVGNLEIHVIQEDGSEEVNLTENNATALQGVWSPDGTRIAFVTDRDGDREIYTMAADGSRPTRVTTHSGDDLHPTWSPDGTQIALTRVDDGKSDIYVVSEAGGEATRLTDDGVSASPDWSPDGSRLVFANGRDGNPEIYVMSVDGTDHTRLTDDSATDGAPNWSPDGSKIIFESNRGGGAYDIFVMSWDGSGVTNVTRTDSDEGVPAWSPDGARIVFTSDREGSPQLFVADADGASPARITSDSVVATHADWQPSTTTGPSKPTTTTETETTEGQDDPVTTGKEVFLGVAGCGGCHTLADAGASGSVGPNLNETLPSYELVIERVTNGQGIMPPFKETLSEQQIQDVAAYVSTVAPGS